MSTPTVPTNRMLQAKILCLVLLLAVLGLAGVRFVSSYLNDLTALQAVDPELAAEKYPRLLFVVSVTNIFIASVAGGALFYIFFKTLQAEQFPPPGMRVLWNTKLRTEDQARRIAIVGVAIAIVLTLCGIGLGVVMISLSRAPIFRYTGPFQ